MTAPQPIRTLPVVDRIPADMLRDSNFTIERRREPFRPANWNEVLLRHCGARYCAFRGARLEPGARS